MGRLIYSVWDKTQAQNLWTHHIYPRLCEAFASGRRMYVEVKTETRTLEQNARMWAVLRMISDGVEWDGQRLEPDEWKDVFSAAVRRQKVVPGVDGGVVAIGASTSRMTKEEMHEMLTMMEAFAAERGLYEQQTHG